MIVNSDFGRLKEPARSLLNPFWILTSAFYSTKTSNRQSESIIRLIIAAFHKARRKPWQVCASSSFQFLSTFYCSTPIVPMLQEVTSLSSWFGSPYETRPQVRCSYLLIPSAHHLTRNLSIPNTSPPSTYINSSSTILTSPNTCSSACSRIHSYKCHLLLFAKYFNTRDLLRKHNHLHKHESSRIVCTC